MIEGFRLAVQSERNPVHRHAAAGVDSALVFPLYQHHLRRVGPVSNRSGLSARLPPLTLPGVVAFSSLLFRFGLVIACLAGPILWGVIVNWLFTSWQERNTDRTKDEEDPVFPDYQI